MKQAQGSYYFQLNILFFALILGAIVFALIAALVIQTSVEPSEDLSKILVPLSIGYGIIAAFLGDFLFRKKLNTIQKEQSLEIRQITFRSAFAIHLAILEGAALFGIVTFALTGSQLALLCALGVIGWMGMNRPSIAKLEKHLFLSSAEKEQMFG